MTLSEYQRLAVRTDNEALPWRDGVLMSTLGLAGEVGEIVECIKHTVYHGHARDEANEREELGDLCWYLAVLAHKLGHDLGDIAQANIGKLRRRYPDGYSDEASRNRDTDAERVNLPAGV